jgi:hypothetical protein
MTYVSVRHGQRRTRKDTQRRTSVSRVSWITLKNQQRRSGIKRRVKYFCKICYKFNHNTQDCWKNPNNQATTKKGSTDVDEGGDDEKGDVEDGGDGGDGEIGTA